MCQETGPCVEQAVYDGIQGTVTIEFVVDDEGRIAHAEIRQSVPPLAAAALAAAREWRFTIRTRE